MEDVLFNLGKAVDLTVITPTYQRPAFLVSCLEQFQRQSLGGLSVEHLVVSDAPDPHAQSICERYGARYLQLEERGGQYGAVARDLGVQAARGEYVCFWDDDNVYEPHALTTLYAAAHGVDLGVVRTVHRFRKRTGWVLLPRRWHGSFTCGDIDTMCVCVRTDIASSVLWTTDCPVFATDYHWLKRLTTEPITLRYLPICIGVHP